LRPIDLLLSVDNMTIAGQLGLGFRALDLEGLALFEEITPG
jgi:hypothetical protein